MTAALGEFNAETWLARSLEARALKARSLLQLVELRETLDQARAGHGPSPLFSPAVTLADHERKLEAAGYAVPFQGRSNCASYCAHAAGETEQRCRDCGAGLLEETE